jgi:hypothetical protein
MASNRRSKIINETLLFFYLRKLCLFKGYTEHIISTSSEWALSTILMIYLLTFLSDFRAIRMNYPKFIDRTQSYTLN